ncbi:MAG: acyl-CoA dehydrogenase, partial [Desulfobacca sp.]|nr:acyl-CoA dehydrogenase [Desulfobacca sp.]
MLNFNLTSDQLELQKRAREFALKEVLPASWHYDEKDETPLFLLRKAFEAGLMNGNI